MSRRMLVLGRSAAALLCLVIAWHALGAAFAGTDSASSNAEKNSLVQKFVVLEFVEKGVAQCEKTSPLVDAMKQKNYPIQLVERANGGEVLFEQYKVETTPTFVFLVDGRESKRFVVKNESVKETRDRLLTLFREYRNELSNESKTTITRGQASELERFASSGTQNNSARPKYGRTVAIPPRQESAPSANAPTSANVAAPTADFSNFTTNVSAFGMNPTAARPSITQVRAFVGVRGTTDERIGAGVVVHYNEEYGEALTLMPASLFAGVDDPLTATNTTLDIISAPESRERVVGQCVFCDAQTGIAFVAARVASPVTPVAFLPQNDVPRVGEQAVVATFNNNNEFVPTQSEILSCDSQTLRLALTGKQDSRGSGVFLVRNERLYFTGLCTSNDAEGRAIVASISLIDQTLLSHSNLSTVYRDQTSGKYEAPTFANSDPQFSAPLLDSTSGVDLNSVDPSTNMTEVFKTADAESEVLNALRKLPRGDENLPNDPNLRLDSPNAPTLDAAPVFANANDAASQTSVSDVPSVLKKNLDSNFQTDERQETNADSNSLDSSIALATNENQALDARAQEIPMASRGADGAFTSPDEIRSTNYASRQNVAAPTANDQETRLFESSLDELRRLSLEGAEIICIVNWGASSDKTKARETEVVRLPRRKAVASSTPGATAATPSSWTTGEKNAAAPNVAAPQATTTGVSDLGILR